jgi:hypothetical protein
MFAVPEPLAPVNKAAVESAISYSKIVFESAEKLLARLSLLGHLGERDSCDFKGPGEKVCTTLTPCFLC